MPSKPAQAEQIELPVRVPSGTLHSVRRTRSAAQIHYQSKSGDLFVGDAVKWLRSLEPASIDLVFADPPYNIGKAEWDDIGTMAEYVAWCKEWVTEAARVLKPSGSIYICGLSEIVSDVKVAVAPLFSGCRWLVWYYRNKANLGKDWGRSHESILHLRKSKTFTLNVDQVRIPYGAHTLKYPEHPQADSSQYSGGKTKGSRDDWTPHPLGAKPKDVLEIPTTCNGMEEKTPHPTQKPEELLRKLILAASKPGDIVIDPFSGSGTTVVVAEQLGRRWMGCDIDPKHNEWAVDRLSRVYRRSVEEWIEFDRKNAARRESIR